MADPLAQIASWPVPTAAAAVVTSDGVVARYGTTDHRFPLASVTKPLAVLGALVAVDEEAIELDRPVIEDVVEGATVAHLMAHASGLTPGRRTRGAAPGTRRIYSNIGIDILGQTVTEASGIDFADYLRQAVFEPAAMTNTSLAGAPSRAGISTVDDLARLMKDLLTEPGWLSTVRLNAATTVQFPGIRGVLPGFGSQDPNDWGFGFEIKGDKRPHWTGTANSAATFGHFGMSGTMLWIDPTAGLGLVALTDRDFDDWAKHAWPAVSDDVLAEFS